jgi:hypothetical protein
MEEDIMSVFNTIVATLANKLINEMSAKYKLNSPKDSRHLFQLELIHFLIVQY